MKSEIREQKELKVNRQKMTGVNLQLACLGWCRENQPMSTDERKTAEVIFYYKKSLVSDQRFKEILTKPNICQR